MMGIARKPDKRPVSHSTHPTRYASILDLIFVFRAFAHFGARFVFLVVVLVVDQGLEDHLGWRWLLAQIARGDLGREAADDEAVELAGREHLAGLDHVDRFL